MRITIDPLLPVVIIILAWILSERYFPQLLYTQSMAVYWVMGVVSSLFLTFSIFIHEFGHGLTARWLKLPLERIHLYLFGGMAELKQRPVRPGEELLIAIAGPTASITFAVLIGAFTRVIHPMHSEVILVLHFVFYMNILLGSFNLLPIFPLDGGRALRAGLWRIRKDYYKASIMTYYISLCIILVFMLSAVVLVFLKGVSFAFWTAFLSSYLWYTAYGGREELIYHPRFEDLIYRIGDKQSPNAIIRQVNRMDDGYLNNAIFPVINNGHLEHVVVGKELNGLPDKEESLEHLYRSVEKGLYVDISDESTYEPGIKLKAELLPVLKNGFILGMTDANEIRFWLLQQKKI